MKPHLITNILAGLFLLTACSVDTVGSSDVNPNAIHQDYSVNYREESNTSSISAQFRVGGASGTTVELEPPSSLFVNGKTLKKNSFFGASYSLSQAGFIGSASFEFTDEVGRRYMNAANLVPVQININPMPIMLGTNYYIPVTTYPLAAGDSLHAIIEQEFVENGISRFVYINGQYEKNYSRFVFTVYDTSRLRNGIARLTISRSQRSALSDTTPRGGGEISSHYYLRPVALTVYGQSFAPNPLLPL